MRTGRQSVRSFIRSYLPVPKFGHEITAFATQFHFWPLRFDTFLRQTDLTSSVIEDDVHFIRATSTPSVPLPLRCPFGTNGRRAVRPLFHESYTLYRHLPSPSLSLSLSLCPPAFLPGYVRCQIGTPTTALLATTDGRTDGKMPNGEMNVDTEKESCVVFSISDGFSSLFFFFTLGV